MNHTLFTKYTFVAMGLLMCMVFLVLNVRADSEPVTFLPDQDKLNTEFLRIDSLEYEDKLDTNKYTYIPTYSYDNKLITVHEYVTPKGEIGYQVFIDDGINIISIGNGSEANARTYNYLKTDLDFRL